MRGSEKPEASELERHGEYSYLDERVAVSLEARRQIEVLPEDEQRRIADGLAAAYGKILELLFEMSVQSYVQIGAHRTLTILSNDTCTIAVANYPVVVRFCHRTFRLQVIRVGQRDGLRSFKVHQV